MSSQGIGWLLFAAAAGPAKLPSDEACAAIMIANSIRRKDIETGSC
jgi:hypothetical protein